MGWREKGHMHHLEYLDLWCLSQEVSEKSLCLSVDISIKPELLNPLENLGSVLKGLVHFLFFSVLIITIFGEGCMCGGQRRTFMESVLTFHLYEF